METTQQPIGTRHATGRSVSSGWSFWAQECLRQASLYIALVASAFIAMGLISLPPTNVTAIWLPSGIALVAMANGMNWRALPVIWLANCTVVYAVNGYPILEPRPFTYLLSLVNTAAPALSFLIWQKWLRGRDPFEQGRDYLQFIFGVALFPNLLSAWLVIAIIHWAGFLQEMTPAEFFQRSGINTMSSALAIILIVPLASAPKGRALHLNPIRLLACTGFALLALILGWATTNIHPLLWALSIPLALFAALGGGPRCVAAAVLALSVYELIMASQGMSPFYSAGETVIEPVFAVSIFAFALSIPGQYAGIAQKQLRQQQSQLESMVEERTSALRETEEQLRLAFEASSDGIFDWSANKQILRCNAAFFSMMNAPGAPRNATWQHLIRFVHNDDRPSVEAAIQAALQGAQPSLYFEARVRNLAEGWNWIRARGKVVSCRPDGQAERIVGTTTNITKEKQHTLELTEATERAKNAEQAKGQFLTTMSHEIRTPLNGVLGFASLLNKTALQKEQIEYTEAIEDAGKTLLTLLNDVLDLSKIEAGAMHLDNQPSDLHRILRNAYKLFQPVTATKGLELTLAIEPGCPRNVICDSVRLQQILSNLISNAAKFTDSGSITLTAGLIDAQTDHPKIEIRVSDTGIGIEPQQLEQLFHDFQQANRSISSRYGGTGLGLSISRKLCRLMGGELSAQSTLGQGSTFIATFSYQPDRGAKPQRTPHSIHPFADTSALRHLRVLVVEDNRMNQKLLSAYLKSIEIDHLIVDDGLEAINVLKHDSFDLILLDLQMPNIDGFETARRIRKLESLRGASRCYIIAVSASAETKIEKCHQVGIDDFIAKPINFPQLGSALKKSIQVS